MYSIHSVKDEKKNCFPSAKHDLILGGCVKCERCTFPTGVAHWKNFRKWQASISASPLTISNRQAGTLKTFPSRFIILSTSLQAKVAPSQKKGREGGKKKKLPAQISREKAFLRARSGRQREAPSHHDRVKIRREKEKREREKGTCRGSEVARISHVD